MPGYILFRLCWLEDIAHYNNIKEAEGVRIRVLEEIARISEKMESFHKIPLPPPSMIGD
jgi:hypothetical protein